MVKIVFLRNFCHLWIFRVLDPKMINLKEVRPNLNLKMWFDYYRLDLSRKLLTVPLFPGPKICIMGDPLQPLKLGLKFTSKVFTKVSTNSTTDFFYYYRLALSRKLLTVPLFPGPKICTTGGPSITFEIGFKIHL